MFPRLRKIVMAAAAMAIITAVASVATAPAWAEQTNTQTQTLTPEQIQRLTPEQIDRAVKWMTPAQARWFNNQLSMEQINKMTRAQRDRAICQENGPEQCAAKEALPESLRYDINVGPIRPEEVGTGPTDFVARLATYKAALAKGLTGDAAISAVRDMEAGRPPKRPGWPPASQPITVAEWEAAGGNPKATEGGGIWTLIVTAGVIIGGAYWLIRKIKAGKAKKAAA